MLDKEFSLDLDHATKKDLLLLPHKHRSEIKIYDSLLVCKNGKHESKYATMLIVGLYNNDIDLKKAEIVSFYSDAIHWKTNNLDLNTDMFFPSGLIHFFSWSAKFQAGWALSSMNIELIKKERE